MSLVLNTNPVTTDGGIKKNIFPGFRPVEYKFKREDLAIVSVGSGVDNNILITVGTDLSSYLSAGDSIYLFAEGDSGTYNYDLTGEIVTITSTQITIDSGYIEGSTSGYINYLINYYVEMELVGEENVNRKVIPFSLKDDGDQAGNITIDVGIANDKNKELFQTASQELTEGRIKFDVRYREVSLGVTGSWTLLSDPVILVYAWEQMETEDIINSFDLPQLYKGYNSGIVICHSDDNGLGDYVTLQYDELDINQQDVTTGNPIGQIESGYYGMIFFLISKLLSFDSDTKYIKFKGGVSDIPDYLAGDYDPAGYLTV